MSHGSGVCPNCGKDIGKHSSDERKECHDKLGGYERNKMIDNVCFVEVGTHPPPYWKDVHTGIIVCVRHKEQYDQSGLGPFIWEEFKV